ncbi:MAG: choice-of-anchor J domain-containing protein, partial [Prevotella sp.]|nr:choice-of-anchor J domain-containing protein [Prevotella sp.]
AVVNYDADKNADNNTSETVSVAVVQPSQPTVTDLSAELSNDAVSLTWTPIVTESETVTDGFEDYDDFTISAMGNWTLYDGDGEKTWKPSMYPDFANAGEPMAYIVFNPSALGIDLSDDDNAEYVPYNGNKFLASMASDSWMTGNNDFIISERLSGNKQTVKLFAKSFDATGYYKETFEIRYSTTGNNPEDFTNTVKTQECGSAWTEYSAELPAGAKYFAIVCTSKNMMMLQIDDVTYEKGGLTASSYNIYRDKELIGTSTTANYLDSDATAGEHVYNVTAVYDEGESSLSNDAVITISGIAEKLNGNAAVVGHYAADGRRIAASEKGMHIVKYNDGTTRKVMVK